MGVEELTIVNFGHPLTEGQVRRTLELANYETTRVIDAPVQFDDQQPFDEQTRQLIERVGLTAGEWQTMPIVVSLPSFGPVVAAVLAMLHGVMGHFPTVVRLRPVEHSVARQFEVAELLSMDQLRANGRLQR